MTNSKTIFITGASSGFGESIVSEALERGHKIIATFRNDNEINEFNSNHNADNAMAVMVDVTNKDQINNAVSKATDKFGKIDVLINNAGMGMFKLFEDTTNDDVYKQFDVNVVGLINMTNAILPHMRKNKSGHIINFSSIAGISSMPGMGVYCASKAAVEAFSKSLRQEVDAFDIGVTLIEPGAFDTKFFESSNFSEMKENANDDYAETIDKMVQMFDDITSDKSEMGDPNKLATVLVNIIEEGKAYDHVPMGDDSVEGFKNVGNNFIESAQNWEKITAHLSNKDDDVKKAA